MFAGIAKKMRGHRDRAFFRRAALIGRGKDESLEFENHRIDG